MLFNYVNCHIITAFMFAGAGAQLWDTDWVGIGYLLYVVGSLLYLIQALNPYMPMPSEDNDDPFSSYYSPGPLTEGNVSGWLGLTAAVLNVVESIFYIIAWYIDRVEEDQNDNGHYHIIIREYHMW
jgi:hypothetical protein